MVNNTALVSIDALIHRLRGSKLHARHFPSRYFETRLAIGSEIILDNMIQVNTKFFVHVGWRVATIYGTKIRKLDWSSDKLLVHGQLEGLGRNDSEGMLGLFTSIPTKEKMTGLT